MHMRSAFITVLLMVCLGELREMTDREGGFTSNRRGNQYVIGSGYTDANYLTDRSCHCVRNHGDSYRESKFSQSW